MLAIRILSLQMCNRSDFNQKFRPHQVSANAVSGRRILAKVLPINFVHSSVPAHIRKKNLVERDVLQGPTRCFESEGSDERGSRFEALKRLSSLLARLYGPAVRCKPDV